MLPHAARLRRRQEFQKIYAAGKAFPESCVVLHVLPLAAGAPQAEVIPLAAGAPQAAGAPLTDRPDVHQVGFSVSKKVGGSVVRNRVKRRLREILRPLLPRLKGSALLVISARTRSAGAAYDELASSVHRALTRAGLLETP